MDVKEIYAHLEVQFPQLAQALTRARVEQAWQASDTYRSHPLKSILQAALGATSDRAVLWNFDSALRHVNCPGGVAEQWNLWLHERLELAAQVSDHHTSASSLGEIRAAGALIEAGLGVIPVKSSHTSTPDFEISTKGSTAVVEVATKLMNQIEAESLRKWGEAHRPIARKRALERGIGFSSAIAVTPAGRPRGVHETIGENVGHKLASIKPRATQASRSRASILWIDLQDDDWLMIDESVMHPVTTFNGFFTSVGGWHGLYGRVGTFTFEEQQTQAAPLERVYTQTYPGLFRQGQSWSAVVLSLRQATLLCENPSPRIPLDEDLVMSLLRLPWAKFELSWINWPTSRYSVSARVLRAEKMLKKLAQHARFLI